MFTSKQFLSLTRRGCSLRPSIPTRPLPQCLGPRSLSNNATRRVISQQRPLRNGAANDQKGDSQNSSNSNKSHNLRNGVVVVGVPVLLYCLYRATRSNVLESDLESNGLVNELEFDAPEIEVEYKAMLAEGTDKFWKTPLPRQIKHVFILAGGAGGLLPVLSTIDALIETTDKDKSPPFIFVFWHMDSDEADQLIDQVAVTELRVRDARYPGKLLIHLRSQSDIQTFDLLASFDMEEDTSPREEQLASPRCNSLVVAAGSQEFLKSRGIPEANGLILNDKARRELGEDMKGRGGRLSMEESRWQVVRRIATSEDRESTSSRDMTLDNRTLK